jgi:hypothetical protein
MRKLIAFTVCIFAFTSVFGQNYKAFSKNGADGYPTYGYKDSQGKIVIPLQYTRAEDFMGGYAIVSLTPNTFGASGSKDFFIINVKNQVASDSTVFREYINMGKGFIQVGNLGTKGNTGQITYSEGRVYFSGGPYALYFKGKRILDAKYGRMKLGTDRIPFATLKGGDGYESGYVSLDGIVHMDKK